MCGEVNLGLVQISFFFDSFICFNFFYTFTTLKIVHFILTIYLLGLSLMTCSDAEIHSSAPNSGFELAHDGEGTHSHNKEGDMCSPFCSCACCGVQIVNNMTVLNLNFPVLTEQPVPQIPHYTPVFASSFSGSIWQPPQINS